MKISLEIEKCQKMSGEKIHAKFIQNSQKIHTEIHREIHIKIHSEIHAAAVAANRLPLSKLRTGCESCELDPHEPELGANRNHWLLNRRPRI